MNERQRPIGKNTPITIGLLLTMGAPFGAGMLATAKADKAERDVSQLQRVNTKILKWLSAIGQRLNVPEPPAD